MNDHQSRSLRHLLRVELSRRRALASLAGAGALGLTGRARLGQDALAQEAATLVRPFDLARTALHPGDLSNGVGYVQSGGITYDGLSGAFESGALSESDVAALEQAGVLEQLLGGHRSTLRDPNAAGTVYTTEVFQFASTTAARAALDALGTLYTQEFDEITSEGERDRFFREIFEEDGDVFDVAVVLFRRQDVVVAITCETELFEEDEEDGPSDGEMVDALTGLSEAVGERVEEILGGAAGLGATVPTPTQFSAGAGSLVPMGRGWRQDRYLWLGGVPIGQQDALAGFPPPAEGIDGVEEAVARQEEIRTYEGKQVLVSVVAYRFDAAATASSFAGAFASAGDVEVQAIEAPDQPEGAPALETPFVTAWFDHRFPYQGKDLYGVSALVQREQDLVGLLIAGLPSGPVDLAMTAALGNWVWTGLGLYILYNNAEELSDAEMLERWLTLYNLSPELCELLLFLDFLA